MCCVAAHEPDGGHTLSLQAEITGSTLRLILRFGVVVLRSTARSTRICPLLLRVLRFHPHGDSVDRSRNIPRFGSQDGDAQRVQQYRQRRLGIRKDAAGHTLETAGSTCDLKGQSTVAHPMHEIDAITSPREIDP